MAALTAKQQAFVDEYLIDLNATQAAIRAGYSAKTAKDIACENLAKPYIADAIAEAMKKRAERVEIRQDDVLRELARIGFSDLRNVLTENGALKNPQDWDDNTAAAISSIEVVTKTLHAGGDGKAPEVEHVHKLKVWDKNTALTNLGKHLSMFTDKSEVLHGATDDLVAAIGGSELARRVLAMTNDGND